MNEPNTNSTGALKGRSGGTVLISGGSRGIGKAIALKLAAAGCNVAIAAKTAEAHPKFVWITDLQ